MVKVNGKVGVPLVMFITLCVTVGVIQTQLGTVRADEAETRSAVKAIAEQVTVHISQIRYQACYGRCIEPQACPAEPQPLPVSRCKRNSTGGIEGEIR